MNIAIIGGGLCGIFAARTLRDHGHEPVIIEKARSIGGRMATRRIGEGRADHGAQFFTVRSKELQLFANEWLEKGWIRRWFGDEYPRYIGINGMNSFLKLLANNLTVHLNDRIVRIEESSSKQILMLKTENGDSFTTHATVVTAPVPQARLLLQQSPLLMTEETYQKLSESNFQPAIVGLITLNQSIHVGDQGIITKNLPAGVDKIIANDKKGISDIPILSVYMSGEWSDEYFLEKDESVVEHLFAAIRTIVSSDLIVDVQLKRWRYAQDNHVYRQPFMKLDNYPVYIAGDSFLTVDDSSGRTRVESAILSGIRVGEAIHKQLTS